MTCDESSIEEVDGDDDGRQDTEADGKSYSDLLARFHTLLGIYAFLRLRGKWRENEQVREDWYDQHNAVIHLCLFLVNEFGWWPGCYGNRLLKCYHTKRLM